MIKFSKRIINLAIKHFNKVSDEQPLRADLFNADQLAQHARDIALEYEQVGKGGKNFLLERLHYNDSVLRKFNNDTLIVKKPQRFTPATEWLIDNFYLIEEHILLSQKHFPEKYSRELPCLSRGTSQELPRVYRIVLEYIYHTDAQIDMDSLLAYFNAYQTVSVLKIGELWAVPIMLRLALIENLQRIAQRLRTNQVHRNLAIHWVTKLQDMVEESPTRLIEVVAEMGKANIPLSSAFVGEFCQRLSLQNPVLHIAREWLEQKLIEQGSSISEMIHQEGQSQAANQVSVGHSINSLRFLGSTDWKSFVEELSIVDRFLRKDPGNIYAITDFSTRDRYRHVIEVLSRKSKYSETEVAQQALELTEKAFEHGKKGREIHVGYYLVDEGENVLKRQLKSKRPFRAAMERLIRRFPLVFYIGSILSLTLLGSWMFIEVIQFGGAYLSNWKAILLIFLFIICMSQLAISIVNWLATLTIRPHALPRLDFSKGIIPACRSIVVTPTMLSSLSAIDHLIEDIELHYLSNPDPYLHFALLTDFRDSKQEIMPDDDELLGRAKKGIEFLNEKYAKDRHDLFFLFHRSRSWNPREKAWMGYERKRGKLMQFNAFLRGNQDNLFSTIVGSTAILSKVKYVITLDTGTQFPHETAWKLIATMAHPLNHPEFDEKKNIVTKGYGILQPRMGISLVSSQRSLYASYFSGDAGIDPYTRAVSDVYQDVFGEGSFIGKGIYDVDAFERALSGRFPENKILSHDLLESTYVRSGLVSDIEMYEAFPSGYNMDSNRRHRWIRGDWQIAQWLLPRVPVLGDKKDKNPISALSKWKLFDNIRRSLVAPALLVFLLISCLLFPGSIWIWPVILFTIVLFPPILSIVTHFFSKSKDYTWLLHLREVVQRGKVQLGQALLYITFLPFDAFLSCDAILGTLKRLLITKKHLLEWQTSADAEKSATNKLSGFFKNMWFSPFIAVIFSTLLVLIQPVLLLYLLPLVLAWVISPGIAWRISRPVKAKSPVFSIEQTKLLRHIARKTWHFFDTFVTEEQNFLPPDNYQEEADRGIAPRTSPTNIGLLFLSNLGAVDMGYLSIGEMLIRSRQTWSTLEKLEKFRGHFYNWYDINTLEPLRPYYISTVDNGNMAGHMFTFSEGLREFVDRPIYTSSIFDGILDTIRVLLRLNEKNAILIQLELTVGTRKTESISDGFTLLNHILEQTEKLRKTLLTNDVESKIWTSKLKGMCVDFIEEIRFVAPWVGVAQNEHYLLDEIEIINVIPTLKEVSEYDDSLFGPIENRIEELSNDNIDKNKAKIECYTFWLNSLHTAKKNAAIRISELSNLAVDIDYMAKMDFTFLYQRAKNLFSIGYNVSEQKADEGTYDLLASEARLASYITIAQGQIPQEHWFSLGRLLVASKNKPVLVSWSGSMFEYLMPMLVMPSFENTLLDQTCKTAVQEQIAYGKTFGVPWGISESGYNRTDTQLNYQYMAFGVPSLGLKRGLSKDLVIAPYATVLALMVAPQKASDNMKRLMNEGAEGTFGFYEAIDYTPDHLRPNESKVFVHSFMAHHQGMSLLSLINVLKDNPMQKRFIGCPMFKAAELLLQERIPHSITANVISDDSIYELEGLNPLETDSTGAMRILNDKTKNPEIHLLSNGSYHVMVSNSGGGYSRWRDLSVTRWREDSTQDCWGLFTYLRDTETGEFWSTAHQPVLQENERYEAIFTQAYAEFRQNHSQIEAHTTLCVSPEDDIELRRIKLINRSNKKRSIELTTYSEVVIAPQAADESHPAFSNLFVQSEFVPNSSAVYCTRRPRSEEEKPPYLVHLLLAETNMKSEISCETDRALFIGRGRTLRDPLAMERAGGLTNSSGSVLDPVVSLRRSVVIPAGESVTFYVALGMGSSRKDMMTLSRKYQDINITERAFKMAWTHSQVVLHQLNASVSDAQLYAKLAGSLVYSTNLHRAETAILKNNRQGQSALWSYSISGDLPLVVIRIADMKGLALVHQLVMAHAFWRLKGLNVEMLILNEDTSVYRQPLHNEIVNLISAGIEAPLLEKPGGIFVRNVEQVRQEDMILLQSVAHILFSDEKGTLAEQMSSQPNLKSLVPTFKPTKKNSDSKETILPVRELIYKNGYGGFTLDGHEYVITLQDGQSTPAPWSNVIANEEFGTVVTESGGAYTWAVNAHEFRLTPWNNDPVQDASGEAMYIRDEETGEYWSPTPSPARGKTPYVIRHGFGYTVYEHNENGIQSELWVYVAMDAPVKFNILKLKNVSGRPRQLSVTGYYEWVLGDTRSKNLRHVQTEIDVKTGALIAHNYYNTNFAGHLAFIDVGELRTITGDRQEFIGRNRNLSKPAAMERTRLSGKVGAGFDPCGAVQVTFRLNPGQERETRFRLGFAKNEQDMNRIISRFQQTGSARKALEGVWEYWNRTLGTINVDTPDQAVNIMTNGWLLYQTLACRLWARSGFYQSGGAFGFRDQLQDVMALVHAKPELARKQILSAASRQFREGDVQHWWHPPLGRGVRTHFSDDYLWLPYVAYNYVTKVGDTGIMDEKISFLEGRHLRADEESYYDLPVTSEENASLYEHCRRSIEYGLKFGIHGLPLMGCGDWNDGMNLVGQHGKGESVWLAFFLYDILIKFSEIALSRDDKIFAARCITQAEELRQRIESNAWDGQWYRRAYFDDGQPLGSKSNKECRIDSIPQSWSVISGAGEPKRSKEAMMNVNKYLVGKDDKIIRLFTPAFDKSTPSPGYIKGYIPGVRENGGQYTHAAIWTIMAFARMRQDKLAWRLFDVLNPIHHGDSSDQIAIYKVEPYVVAADVYAATQHTGRGGWTWYTGSASWMYRLLVEELMGINVSGSKICLSPSFKPEWESYKVHYRYKQTVYHITFNKINDKRKPQLILDEQILPENNNFELKNDKIEHFVNMWVL